MFSSTWGDSPPPCGSVLLSIGGDGQYLRAVVGATSVLSGVSSEAFGHFLSYTIYIFTSVKDCLGRSK